MMHPVGNRSMGVGTDARQQRPASRRLRPTTTGRAHPPGCPAGHNGGGGVILLGITDEHCLGCDDPTDQPPLCDDCLIRWSSDPERDDH